MRRLTDREREDIVLLKARGLEIKDIARVIGCSEACIYSVLICDRAAKKKDVTTLLKQKTAQPAHVRWAMAKYGIETLGEPVKEVKSEESAVCIPNNEGIAITLLAELLKEIRQTNELLSKLL